MNQAAFIDRVCDVAQAAKPLMHVDNEEKYQEVLGYIDALMQLAEDDPNDVINSIISSLAHAVEEYENRQPDIHQFLDSVQEGSASIATLRVLIAQHGLKLTDFPEIGDPDLENPLRRAPVDHPVHSIVIPAL
ncbi:hypothetical protein [Thiohalophilus sp.]|uniref:hypothetical protein n=1 Tax=Thiohalophilus sp. TaxID=3028392 RepID=UPI002ACDC252|nr:hypothetical protein [Thiohalophilus sp.]MDZ7803051.1 hypothetical protein [Thiohalophilus sp.]